MSLHCSVVSLDALDVSLVLPPLLPYEEAGLVEEFRRGPRQSVQPPRPSSAAGDDSETFGDAGHVVQHDAQEEKQHTCH